MADAYKRLAALRPADTSEAELYAVPAGAEVVANLTICNQDTVERTVQVAHTDIAGAAAGEDWMLYDEVIAANTHMQITGITMAALETIRVQASIGGKVSFILAGLEVT